MDIIFYISMTIIVIIALVVKFVDFNDDNMFGLIATSSVFLLLFLSIEVIQTYYPANNEYKTTFYENRTEKPVKVLFMVRRIYMNDHVKEAVVMPMSYVSISNSKIVSEMPLIDIFDVN